MIHFVGAGPGAADLITMRGAKLLQETDIIIYAGSLVNPALLEYAKVGCQIYNSAEMTLEEVIEVMKDAESKGLDTVRLHTGDASLYGAIREQMDLLDELGIEYTCILIDSCCIVVKNPRLADKSFLQCHEGAVGKALTVTVDIVVTENYRKNVDLVLIQLSARELVYLIENSLVHAFSFQKTFCRGRCPHRPDRSYNGRMQVSAPTISFRAKIRKQQLYSDL